MAQTPDGRDALVADDGRTVPVLLDYWARFVWWGTDGDVAWSPLPTAGP